MRTEIVSPKAVYTREDLQNWPQIALALHPPARLAVLGDPVAHSRSPQMHNAALRACEMEAQYIRLHVKPGQIKETLALLQGHGFYGCNVTIPHKLEMLEAVDEVDPLARRMGAVNTVVFDQATGRATGYNSDGPGLAAAVRESFGINMAQARVLILGAGGGAGRATAVYLAATGCQRLVLANRTEEKARALAEELSHSTAIQPQSCPWEEGALAEILPHMDLIINASSLGMKAEDRDLIPPALLQPQHCVYDMVYAGPSANSRLVTAAQEAGARAANGLSMLLHQGAISFARWFGQEAPLELMRKGLSQ